jgi:BirA family biotin operon repressor/biotin-[acetyl-CoA-carboxylase] ligase
VGVSPAPSRHVPQERGRDAHATETFELASLRFKLKPFRLHFFPRIGSTNSHAIVLRKRKELFAPAVILAGRQVKGRGRGSNTWWSGEGSLAATFALPVEDHLQPHQVPLIAGLAVRDAVATICGVQDIGLKWPNDLLHDRRKLAGLLCERLDRIDLIGVGINVNVVTTQVPKALREKVTSLRSITGVDISLSQLVVAIAQNLRQMLSRHDQPSFAPLLKEYDRYHVLVGRTVRVTGIPGEPSIRGRVTGLDDLGRLLLRDAKQKHAVIAGSIEILDR